MGRCASRVVPILGVLALTASPAGALVDPLGKAMEDAATASELGVPEDPQEPVGKLPFEEMRYDAEKGGVSVGQALFRVRAQPEGRSLRIQFCTTGLVNFFRSVRYQLYSELNGSGPPPQPHFHRLTRIQGGSRKETLVRFDDRNGQAKAHIEKRKEGEPNKTETKSVPSGIQENLSVINALRELPLEVGETYRLPLLDGGEVETLVVPVKERTKDMERSSIRIAPFTVEDGEREEGSQWSLTLTDDVRRVPLRIQMAPSVGGIELTLDRYRDRGQVIKPDRMFCDPKLEVPGSEDRG